MSQVIIVSNRLPVSVRKENGQLSFYPSVGGLATGLSSYIGSKKQTWIGWPGIASEELTDKDKRKIVTELAKHKCSPVWLSRRQIDEFYNGYSNTVLWPVFHSMNKARRPNPNHKRWWQTYRSVNQLFAEAVLNISETDSRIWVHDYQLLLVPKLLRTGRSDINIGFFLHIPFPKLKIFAHLSENKKLLDGMLGADVIGFHTPDYVANFVDTSHSLGLTEIDNAQLVYQNRMVRVSDFPMGIDYEKYSSANKTKAVKKAVRQYRRHYRGKKVILAVSRLDPSKGLLEMLQAYSLFLHKYPNMHGKVVFVMVAAPSRTDVVAYQRLSVKLKEAAEKINTDWGSAKWQPIEYISISIPFEEVTALFHIADVAFITPLRDGMNLVAKEYVASAKRNGVLILSETAGASQELHDAIIVNPRKPEELAESLQQALNMRRRELRKRLKRMRHQLSTNTVQDWAKEFVSVLNQPVPGTPILTRTLRARLEAKLIEDYRSARRRLLFLDYDGSLVPFTADYLEAKPPKSLLNLLEKLSADPRNDVVMISGRSPMDLEKWFGDLRISLVAEHGASLRKSKQKDWQVIEKPDIDWKKVVLPVLEKYTALTPRARIEIKPHNLVWHYRAAPPYYAQKYAVIIKRALKPLLRKYDLELMQGNKVLEIKNPQISKAKAAQSWLTRRNDFILSLGDDTTDEELFEVLPETAYGIKVGRGLSHASYRLASYKQVNALLKKLSKQV
jgi:trehalose 6-phosphate synthase/phosphatase